MMQMLQRPEARMDEQLRDVGLLVLRASVGSFLAGHGAQKLFGAFGGYGVAGTAGWLESLGLRPGKAWALAAGAGEFGGGVLTTLGLATPLGLVGSAGAMGMAIAKGHWGKPVWVTSGGAELPLTNLAAAAALALAGPGRYSLDAALGWRLPRWLTLGGLAVTAAVVAAGAMSQPIPELVQDAARDELQAEGTPAPADDARSDAVESVAATRLPASAPLSEPLPGATPAS